MNKKFEKAYVLYANEAYFEIVKTCVKSIREFSNIPVIVYFLNCDLKIDIENVFTINWICDLRGESSSMYHESDENFYINRSNEKIFRLLIQRPNVVKDALQNHAETVAYIDSDSIVTNYIDRVFDLYDTNEKFPYFTEGPYDFLHMNGRGGAMSRDDLSTTLEHPACELFNINQYVRERYRTTNIFIAGQNSIEFLEEWYWMCNHPKVLKEFGWYAPFHEETIMNVLLWKNKQLKGLPYVYTNGGSDEVDEIFTKLTFKGYEQHIREWFRIPSVKENLLVFHGEKRIEKMEEIISKIKFYSTQKKKGLYFRGKKIADKGYIINLRHRIDRLERTTKLFYELGFEGYEVFDAVSIEEPEYKKLGCTASYLKIFKEILNSDVKDVLIFEDDIKLMDGVNKQDLERIFFDWDEISTKYDIVALGTKVLPRTKVEFTNTTHGSFEEMLCTQSLYYKKEIIEHITKELSGCMTQDHYLHKCTIDMFLNDCSSDKYRFVHSDKHKKFNFGITIPMIFSQTESFSDNENRPQNYDVEIRKNFFNAVKKDKGYVLLTTENYLEITEECVKSIRKFSDFPIFVYLINSSKKINVHNTFTINWKCNIGNISDNLYEKSEGNFYIDRRNPTIYKILIQKPLIVKHVLSHFLSKVCFVDSDSVATNNVDKIFNFYNEESTHPLFVEGVYDYMKLYGRGGGPSFGGTMSDTLEFPACELFGVDQSVRKSYRQTGYFVSGQNTFGFLDEWYSMCNHPKILENCSILAPFNEETVMNVLLWKYNIQSGLPYIYINGGLEMVDKIYTQIKFLGSNTKNYIGDWIRVPDSKRNLFFFHGEKNPVAMNQMTEKIKEYNNEKKLNILFLAPHLSTGGMPGFLLKKIQLLKKYCSEMELFVVEFQNYGDAYVVQKNQIKGIIDRDKFWTLGDDKFELIEILNSNEIDVVHVEEMIEGFDSFNQVPAELMSKLYNSDRTWRMVETCHNVWFNHKQDKIFYPEAFAFCTPYHKEITFKDVPSYSEVIEFPIEKVEISEQERLKARRELGFGKDKLHVINVGLWTKGKNQGEGVEIAKLLRKSNPEIMFHFIGNQAQNFKEYWGPIMKSIPMNVKVWGERADIDKFMKAADVFMFNSTWECNPLVLREAISYGLKILTRNLPQYMNMFTEYIENIDDDIQVTKDKLLKILNEKRKYDVPIGREKSFAASHKDFYNKVIEIPIKEQKFQTKLTVIQNFINQPFIEIKGKSENKFKIQFFDESGQLHYDETLNINSWVRLNRQYYTKWTTKVWENDNLVYEYTLDYEGKRVLISFDSKSLGDTVSWIPYVLEFQNKHKCKVVVSTFWNNLFQSVYPELEFVPPGSVVGNIHGMYKLGWFNNLDMQPRKPKTIPLQQTATDILGLDFVEIQPRIKYEVKTRPYEEKYITIATNSTAGCKFWTREGWQELINYLTGLGYKVVNVSKENNPFDNQTRLVDTSIENTMNVIHHSEFFIGLSSGLSWLAWGMGKHVVMISNFTTPDHEFQSNCTRIINLSVCNGCWNKLEYEFDRGDWDWCPVHKGTEKQFECHKSITPKMVILQIQNLLR